MASLYYWLICWHWEILLGTPSSTENSSLLHKGILRLNPTMAGQHCCIYMDKKVEKKRCSCEFSIISDLKRARAWTVSVLAVCFWSVFAKSCFLQLLLCVLLSFSSCCHVSVWGLMVEQFFLFSLAHPWRFCASFCVLCVYFLSPRARGSSLFRLTLPSREGKKYSIPK